MGSARPVRGGREARGGAASEAERRRGRDVRPAAGRVLDHARIEHPCRLPWLGVGVGVGVGLGVGVGVGVGAGLGLGLGLG